MLLTLFPSERRDDCIGSDADFLSPFDSSSNIVLGDEIDGRP